MKRALIVGSEGQDGRILFDRLAGEGFAVLGLGRASARSSENEVVQAVDLDSRREVAGLVERWQPEEIYYLAAEHQASQDSVTTDDAALFDRSLRVHLKGLIYFLEALKTQQAGGLFYAASSLVFGDAGAEQQDEETPFRPRCIYGITKAAGVHACRFYRMEHGVRASVGLLYNHESPLRRPSFVSQKIVRGAVAVARGHQSKLTIGDLSACVDWGYAPDYVEAMTLIVRHPVPDDYIVATGEAHSVQEFVEVAFSRLGLDWRSHVVEDGSLLRRSAATRVGNPGRLRERTGWRPRVAFAQMIEILLEAALLDDA